MIRFVARRLIISIGVLWAVATATFFVLHLTGDPVTAALETSGATSAQIAKIKHELGFDRPILFQYASFLNHVIHGNFGNSFQYGTPALQIVLQHLPYTLELTGTALAAVILVAPPVAVISAYHSRRFPDHILSALVSLGQSVPNFVAGPIFILIFAVVLHAVPVAGATSPASLILPAITLSLYPIARVARVLRASVLDVIDSDYVRTARAKGVSELTIATKHVTRNALLPTITVIGLQIASLLGGAVIVEAVFAWPGIGTLAQSAFTSYDFSLSQTIVIFVATMVVLVNLLVDIVYAFVDPRIRYQ